MSALKPIGVFDSGVGGLSVLHEIRRALPGEHLLYVADSAYAPYGEKTEEIIEARSTYITGFLQSCNAKAVVVACNTATGAAVSALRSTFTFPIVAMEPAIKPAAAQTQSGVIAVLATNRTLSSHNFVKLYSRYGTEVEILAQACPGLVEQVEAGDLSGLKTRALLEHYLKPLLERHADAIVLGCTHYPFLRPLIRQIAGPDVAIIDSSEAIARELKRRLGETGLLSPFTGNATERFWTSSEPEQSARVISMLWESQVKVEQLPESNPFQAVSKALS